MKKHKVLIGICLVMFIFLFVGCNSKSEKEALEDTKAEAQKAFNNKEIEANRTMGDFSFYLPNDLEVTEKSKNNLMLEDGNQTYILFYNKLEESTSRLNYNAAQTDENSLLLESFEDEDRFGYVRVLSMDDGNYELQAGVGGVKVTTYSTTGKMSEDVKAMMNVANSIAYTSGKNGEDN